MGPDPHGDNVTLDDNSPRAFSMSLISCSFRFVSYKKKEKEEKKTHTCCLVITFRVLYLTICMCVCDKTKPSDAFQLCFGNFTTTNATSATTTRKFSSTGTFDSYNNQREELWGEREKLFLGFFFPKSNKRGVHHMPHSHTCNVAYATCTRVFCFSFVSSTEDFDQKFAGSLRAGQHFKTMNFCPYFKGCIK